MTTERIERLSAPMADDMPEVGPPPCDNCALAKRCGAELVACTAFADYVNSNRWRAGPRSPSREGFERVFSGEEDATPAKPAKRRSAWVTARLAAIAAGGAP